MTCNSRDENEDMQTNLTAAQLLKFVNGMYSEDYFELSKTSGCLEHTNYDGKKHAACCWPALSGGNHVIKIRVDDENKEYNDCGLGFCQKQENFTDMGPNIHRDKTQKSVFMDCYGGGTYIDGVNQNNKTTRPEVGSVIIIEADFSTG